MFTQVYKEDAIVVNCPVCGAVLESHDQMYVVCEVCDTESFTEKRRLICEF